MQYLQTMFLRFHILVIVYNGIIIDEVGFWTEEIEKARRLLAIEGI